MVNLGLEQWRCFDFGIHLNRFHFTFLFAILSHDSISVHSKQDEIIHKLNTCLLGVKLFVWLSEISACVCFSLCLPVDSVYWCSCPLFCFKELSDLCSCVSNHTVLLVAVFLHKSPFPPYQRGFFCNDNSIRLTYKSSTVSNTVLTAVGVTVPVVSVSSAVVLQDN